MKLEAFFEKFELFADAPDAAAKMRDLVLRLAFSGGLTDAKRSDDGAPKGWERRTIESICSSITPGFACSRNHQMECGHVHLRTHNISTLGTLNFDLLVRIDPKMVDPQKASIRKGDILFNNTNSQDLVGKTCLIDRDYDYGFSNHITRLRLNEDVFPGFVVYYLTFLRNSGYFAKICTRWINQAAVNTDTLKKQIIPLPPLAEQKRIVAKVDELMALCDRLEAQQQERDTRQAALVRASLARFTEAPTPANLEFLFHPSYEVSPADLRKTILTLAVQGKLVAQDPDDELASASFPKLAESRVESNGDDFPVHWLRVPLGKMGEWRGGGTPSKSRPDFWEGDLPWVTPKDMKVLHIADAQDHISPTAVEGSSVRLIPPGSLLMVVRGMILARTFPVALTTREVTINQDMKALLPFEPNTKDYLLVALRAFESAILGAVEHSSHGTCKLRTEFLQEFVIPIPPLAEQRRIVAKVEQLMALVDELEQQLAASLATAEELLTALVAELVNGKKNHAPAEV